MKGGWRIGRLVGGALLAAAPLAASAVPGPPSLRAGERLELQVAPPAAAAVAIRLEGPGDYALWAEQRGVDIALTLETPPVLVDAPLDRRGQELLVVSATEAGTLPLRLLPREKLAPAGQVVLRLEKIAPGDPRRPGLEAWSRAGESYAALGGADPTPTLETWRSAWQLLRESAPAEARRLRYCLAVLLRLAHRSQEALDEARATFAELEAEGPDAVLFQAAARNEIGLDRWQLGDAAGAQGDFRAAGELAGRAGDDFTAAAAAGNACLMELVLGRVRDGLACYGPVLPRLGPLPAEHQTALLNVGRAADVSGEPEQAFAAYHQALELARQLGDELGAARVHNNLGVLARQLGDFEPALEHYGQALAIFERLGEKRWRARVYGNLGALYGELAEHERALFHLEKALEAWRELEDPAGEAAALGQLGRLAEQGGRFDDARALVEKALELDRRDGRQLAAALDLSNLGGLATRAGRPADALPPLREAIALLEEQGDKGPLAGAFCRLGRAELALGEVAAAKKSFESSLGQGTGWQGEVLCAQLGLARVARARGDLAGAFDWSRIARANAAGVRRALIAPELRAAFSGLEREVDELEVELWMSRHRAEPAGGFAGRALEAAERAKARTLGELLFEAKADLPRQVDAAAEQALRSALARLAAKVERLAKAQGAERETLELERAALEREIDRRERELRLAHPSWAAGRQPAPLDAATLKTALGDGAVLLAYFLGDERSYLWRVEAGALEVFALPPRAELEEAARAYAAALAAPRSQPLDPGLGEKLAALLLGPVAERPPGDPCVVVPDGALAYLPFATLPLGGERLVDRAAAVQLPSLQSLILLRQSVAGRAPASRSLAVFADPVFAADDPRVAKVDAPASAAELDREPPDVLPWPRLPATRREAEAILAALPAADRPSALALYDFGARRDAVLGDRLRDYRTLHFASHGLIDSRRPALSSLLLSTFDAGGRPVDGRLTLHDIHGLELGADLVVLSGCRTALGKELRAEGLVGLVRGFFYAGSPRVLASLWPVEDRATAELMAAFYQGLWGEGLPAAEALRAAQRKLAADRRYRDPRLWGAFVLAGEWRR